MLPLRRNWVKEKECLKTTNLSKIRVLEVAPNAERNLRADVVLRRSHGSSCQ